MTESYLYLHFLKYQTRIFVHLFFCLSQSIESRANIQAIEVINFNALFWQNMFCLKTLFLVLSIKYNRRGKSKIKMKILDVNTTITTVQVNAKNIQKFSSLNYWLDIKIIVLFLLISILKVLTGLIYAYFEDLLKLSGKNGTNTNR